MEEEIERLADEYIKEKLNPNMPYRYLDEILKDECKKAFIAGINAGIELAQKHEDKMNKDLENISIPWEKIGKRRKGKIVEKET